jgi:triosephosphate isomerase
MKRQKIVAGNWKMNLNSNQARDLTSKIVSSYNSNSDVHLILCPPYPYLSPLSLMVQNNSTISIGAQNCYSENSGAFTGEVSAEMIQSCGAKYVIIGHSERRTYFNESNTIINQKIKLALQYQLKPIFCCGEVLSERESNIQESIVENQILEAFDNLSPKDIENIVVAYEPVWAIGTGKTATPSQAQDMHFFIRNLIFKNFNVDVPILYGGSCKPDNAKELFSMPDIDGGLIGGASLKSDDFLKIASSF